MKSTQPAWIRNMPAPDTVVVHRFPNGLQLYLYENHSVPAVVVNGALRVGSVCDPPEKYGLATLMAGMLRRGTRSHSFTQLNEQIESVGATVELSGGRHALDIYAKALAEDLDMVLTLIAEMLQEPAFPEDEFQRLKQQTLTRIQERDNDTHSMAYITFRRLLYGATHPYGHPVTGNRESVSRITYDDVRSFYNQHVGPQNGQFVIVGDIDPVDVITRMDALFSQWHGPSCSVQIPNVQPPSAVRSEHVTITDKAQSDFVLGWLCVPRKHPDWTPVVVANTIWGRFGMGGRIGEQVREKQGLAYYVYGSVEGNFAAGTWSAVAGVSPDKVQQAVDSILVEVQRLREEPVTAQELADAQEFLIGSMPIRLETNEGIAAAISDMVWYDLGLDYLLHLEDRVRKVTPEDVQRVAQTYLDVDAYVLAVAGPSPY